MQLGRFKIVPLLASSTFIAPYFHYVIETRTFLKDASFCPCFCFVHTIAQFSRILRFSHIYCQIFRIRTHGWRMWRTTALTSTIGSEKFQKFIKIFTHLLPNFSHWHEQVKIRKKRWNNKEIKTFYLIRNW